jgi:hypothetical protein
MLYTQSDAVKRNMATTNWDLVCAFFTPTCLWRWNRHRFPKLQHIKFRRRGITQKKAYSIQNTAKVWNKKLEFILKYRFFIIGKDFLNHEEWSAQNWMQPPTYLCVIWFSSLLWISRSEAWRRVDWWINSYQYFDGPWYGDVWFFLNVYAYLRSYVGSHPGGQ